MIPETVLVYENKGGGKASKFAAKKFIRKSKEKFNFKCLFIDFSS
jgi:hypothetical protein